MTTEEFAELTLDEMKDYLLMYARQCVDGVPVGFARKVEIFIAKMQEAENAAVSRLEALGRAAGEEGHMTADNVLLEFAPARVRDLYENLDSMWYA